MEAGWDFLNIHDGAGTWATGLGSFHGSSIPPTVTGSGEAITVRLTTDFSITAPGFQASFTCVDASASGGNNAMFVNGPAQVDVVAVNGIPGYTTVRLSVTLAAEQTNVYALAGSSFQGSPMVFPPAYQVAAPFGADIGGTPPAYWQFTPESQYDSWLTVGVDDGSAAGALAASPGLGLAAEWTATTGFNHGDGAVFWMDPASGPVNNNIPIVMGQMSITNELAASGGEATAMIQGQSTLGEDYQTTVTWVWSGMGGGAGPTPPASPPSPPPAPVFECSVYGVNDCTALTGCIWGGSECVATPATAEFLSQCPVEATACYSLPACASDLVISYGNEITGSDNPQETGTAEYLAVRECFTHFDTGRTGGSGCTAGTGCQGGDTSAPSPPGGGGGSGPPPAPPSGGAMSAGCSVEESETALAAGGYTTIQLKCELPANAANVYAMSGTPDGAMSFPAAYQVPTPFGSDLGAPNAQFIAFNADVAFDSYLTVGQEQADLSISPGENGADKLAAWGESETVGFETTDGAIFYMDPDSGPASNGAMLFAQLTLASGVYAGGGTASAQLQGRSVGGADDWAGYAVAWQW